MGSLLIAVSSACRTVSYTGQAATPMGVCNPANSDSAQLSSAYYCKGDVAKYAVYNSLDCSGTPQTATVEESFSASGVVAECDEDLCANVVTQTVVVTGCVDGATLSDDMSYTTTSYAADECTASTVGSTMWTCESGTATQMVYLSSTDCTGDSPDTAFTVGDTCTDTILGSIGNLFSCGSASFTVNESGANQINAVYAVLFSVVASICFSM